MRGRRAARVVIGLSVAAGMLSAVPVAVFATTGPACGDTLTTNTTLTTDLDCSAYDGTALTLGANGITLDLNGYTITGFTGDDNDTGVYTEHDGDTITNGTIQNFQYGVYVSSTRNTTVSWLTVIGEAADTSDRGMYIEESAAPQVTHNTVSGEYDGIYLYGNGSARVARNDVTADNIGFYFEYGTNDLIAHNVAHSSYGFYNDYSAGQVYQYNTANGGSETGFYMDCDDYGQVTLLNNTANGNSGDGFYTTYCYVDPPGKPHPSLIKGNTANGNGDEGFADYYSVGATFRANIANHNGDSGFYLDYPGDQTIVRNIARGNSDSGIELDDNYGTGYGLPTAITANTLKGNEYGVYANYGLANGICHGNVIANNTIAPTHKVNCT